MIKIIPTNQLIGETLQVICWKQSWESKAIAIIAVAIVVLIIAIYWNYNSFRTEHWAYILFYNSYMGYTHGYGAQWVAHPKYSSTNGEKKQAKIML